MPKIEIDYSNTIIYKITCKDPEIKDVYVGHTTNFVQRKHAHKQCCNNPKSSDCKLYKTIREKGGWSNWKMEIINFFDCKDHYEARKKEQEYFISLNANLNSIEPMPKPKEKPIKVKQLYVCNLCNIDCHTIKGLETHNETNKHKKHLVKSNHNACETDNMAIKTCDYQSITKYPKISKYLICQACDFITNNKKDYNRHLLTSKHKNETKMKQKYPDLPQEQIELKCHLCCNTFSSRTTLWRHKKNCIPQNESIIDASLFMHLMKQNDEFKTLLIEQHKSLIEQNTKVFESHNQIIEICKNTNTIHNTKQQDLQFECVLE
jgi:hypothetical protein